MCHKIIVLLFLPWYTHRILSFLPTTSEEIRSGHAIYAIKTSTYFLTRISWFRFIRIGTTFGLSFWYNNLRHPLPFERCLAPTLNPDFQSSYVKILSAVCCLEPRFRDYVPRWEPKARFFQIPTLPTFGKYWDFWHKRGSTFEIKKTSLFWPKFN